MSAEPTKPRPVATGTVARLAAGTATTLAGRFLGRGLALLTQVVLARSLGPAPFGVFTLAWAAFRLATVAGIAGFDKAITRFASVGCSLDQLKGDSAGTVRRILVWGLSIAIIVGISLRALAPILASVLDSPGVVAPLRTLALAVPLAALVALVAASLRTRGRAFAATWVQDLIQPALTLALLPLALLSESPVAWAAGVVTASYGVAALSGGLGLRRSLAREQAQQAPGESSSDRVSNRRIVVYALHALSSTSFVLLLYWLDKLMVGYFLDEAAVGLYQSAVQFNVIFVIIIASISAMLSPLVARCWNEGRRDEVEGLFRIGVRWCLYLAVPVVVMILILPAQLLEAVFGSAYVGASSALIILGLGQFFNAATGPVGQLLMMTGGERAWFILSGCSVPLSLTLNALLIPRFGIEGAAMGTGVTLIVLFGTATVLTMKRNGLRPYDWSLARVSLAALLASIVPAALRWGTELRPWPVVLLGGLATVLVFGSTLWWFGFDASERAVGRRLRARMGTMRERRMES